MAPRQHRRMAGWHKDNTAGWQDGRVASAYNQIDSVRNQAVTADMLLQRGRCGPPDIGLPVVERRREERLRESRNVCLQHRRVVRPGECPTWHKAAAGG